jgi:heme-degrading monooxygenase HmoA
VIARIWRGWCASDVADEVASDLRRGVLAQYAGSPGNVSVSVLLRPSAGGVELMTYSIWESADAAPPGVAERHPLLVARQTVADCWEIASAPEAAARAA